MEINSHTITVLSFIALVSCSVASAQNKVVVVPIFGDGTQTISNVVTVAKEGGDFNSPTAAMASIQDASESNPYLIAIAPGVYDVTQTLNQKDYVSIVGSGEQNTKIQNTNPNNPNTLSLELIAGTNTSISSISIENSSGGSFCNAITGNGGQFAVLKDVTAIASSCTQGNLAIDLDNGPQQIDQVTAIADGGQTAVGVNLGLLGPHYRITNSRIQASRGTTYSAGIRGLQGTATIINSEIVAEGTLGPLYGIKYDGGNVVETRVATLQDSIVSTNRFNSAHPSFGVHMFNTSNYIARRVSISAETAAIFVDSSSSLKVSGSTLEGSTTAGTGNTGSKQCVTTDDGNSTLLNSGCELPMSE